MFQNRRNADVRPTVAERTSAAEINSVSAPETLPNAGRTIWYGTVGKSNKNALQMLYAYLMALREVVRAVNTDADRGVAMIAAPVTAVLGGVLFHRRLSAVTL